jgi:opacity protein-like surface antigen
VRDTVGRLEKGEVKMRRFVLGVVLAAGLSVAASGAASAQGTFGYPNYQGYPGYGFSQTYGPGYGGGPYGSIPDPYGYGFPASYQYPYGYPFGTPPIYGQQGGIGFTFNSLNNAPFGTAISIANTSSLPTGLPGFPGVRTSITVLPLSAAGRISLAPTNAGNYFNEVIIR